MFKFETGRKHDYLPKKDCTSDEDDQESLEWTSDEDDQESLKAKISSKETIENQIEGNGKGIASVEKELNLKDETTIVKKKDIEEEVQRNTERKECLEKELDEIRRSKETIIDDREKKIKALEEEIETLNERNKEFEKELQELRESLKKIEEENKEKNAIIEKLGKDSDYNQSLLILMQIGKTLQRNMCKYVLGEYFKESFFYKYENIDRYIKRFVPARDQESAKKRRKELDEKCPWDQDLVDSLKTLKEERNDIAHPQLSSEKIQQATKYLRGINKITDEMEENIMGLKALWETSEDL